MHICKSAPLFISILKLLLLSVSHNAHSVQFKLFQAHDYEGKHCVSTYLITKLEEMYQLICEPFIKKFSQMKYFCTLTVYGSLSVS